MSRIRSSWSVVAALAVCVSTVTGAQVMVRPPSPVQRDTPHAGPNERLIPVGTSAISGTVQATDTGLPVPGARVTLNGLGTCIRDTTQGGSDSMWMTRTVVTDASGEFAFPRLPAGVFKLSVQSPIGQFLATNYGERRPGGQGQSIQLADGQKIALKVPMMRGGVIAGTVRGPDGEPQRNIQVRALRYDRSSGFKRLQSVSYAKADDRGAYRLFGLQPGDYVIAATPNAMDSYQIHRGAESEAIERAIQSAPVTAARDRKSVV